MNKPLKFRICYTDRDGKKSMIYSDDNRFLIGLNGKVYENYGKDWRNPTWEEVFDANETPIIQQYTGLTDSKGNEIYEGDVVKTIYNDDFSVGTVFHHEETGSYRIQSKNQLLPIVTYRFVENKPQGLLLVVHEVIGNIFENNELLTQYEQNK